MSNPQMAVVFADEIPEVLEELTLYVSVSFATAIHLCACGCQLEVVTPLTPSDWRLIFNGTFTLHPSIGNWSLPCRSHYLLIDGEVEWAPSWSQERIDVAREHDRRARARRYGESVEGSFRNDAPVRPDSLAPWWKRPFGRARR